MNRARRIEEKEHDMILGIDFDGTCVDNCFPEIGEDVPGCVDALLRLSAAGHELYLWTCREGKRLEEAERWFGERGIPLAGINRRSDQDPAQPKLWAHKFVDDAAVGCPTVLYYSLRGPVVNWPEIERLLQQEGEGQWAKA